MRWEGEGKSRFGEEQAQGDVMEKGDFCQQQVSGTIRNGDFVRGGSGWIRKMFFPQRGTDQAPQGMLTAPRLPEPKEHLDKAQGGIVWSVLCRAGSWTG